MLLKNNIFGDRTVSAISPSFELQRSKTLIEPFGRKTLSSNSAHYDERSNDIDAKFKINQTALPKRFLDRWTEDNFKNSNKFSDHDNRNRIQSYGEYFGQGYGRKLIETSFYKTDPAHLAHEPVDPQSYITTNKYHFSGGQLSQIDRSQRRFPRSYSNRQHKIEPNDEKQSDSASSVYNQTKDKFSHYNSNITFTREDTNVHSNPWKYSYKKGVNVYPNIRLQQIRKSCIDLSKY